MAARFSSSAILRSALATQISLSATSVLCSTFGPSQFQSPTTFPNNSQNPPQTPSSSSPPPSSPRHHRAHNVDVSAALPWLDQLHNLIADIYLTSDGAGDCQRRRRRRANCDVAMVRMGEDVSFESPLVFHAGAAQVERSFRGRSPLRLSDDVETVLECVNVEASDDSICGGVGHPRRRLPPEGASAPPFPLPSANNDDVTTALPSPPELEVTYRLSQQYGAFLSVDSLLVVTVRVRRGSSRRSEQEVRRITPRKEVPMPLATSGFTPRAASAAAARAATTSGLHYGAACAASSASARAASEIVAATTARGGDGRSPETACRLSSSQIVPPPLVAEVVRIEERWNGGSLIHFAPFHWSRRLNGLVAGGVSFLFFR